MTLFHVCIQAQSITCKLLISQGATGLATGKRFLTGPTRVQVISKAVYKFVLQKVVDKVMQSHGDASTAAFLMDESGRIQRLVQEYIKHCERHGVSN